ncbi:hypothetical protein BCR32DRAFT_200222 [Anaeromyces robustus]|uniref:CDP-diacylglycerol--glycerol-3-phosphate 3-phosphatidyltransferase n=1 Tax=Anaeromyces robustus TaxID=1754192 RepID=A0A1Y1XHJ2_9FUNG|nr:hypothetical protein BCR32DRAFT_200222 [Anaeromyces robustus]|eukprot:ORX85210.1 hypothetical protein BCR32DRAFT_200222 [Anaeromyces robustus]
MLNTIIKNNVANSQKLENCLDFTQSQNNFHTLLNKQDTLKLQPINLSRNQECSVHNNSVLPEHHIIQNNNIIQDSSLNNLIQKNYYSEKVINENPEIIENGNNKDDKDLKNKEKEEVEEEVKEVSEFYLKKNTVIPLFKPIYNESAVFSVDSSKIEIIKQPTDYYNKIKEQILQAKHRVVLTALYIGIDQVDLVQTLHKALSENKSLRVTILFDCLRGTRTSHSGESSVTLVAPLVTAYPDRVEVALYHTPELTKPLKMLLPQRFNEIIGLFHAKIVIGDDNLILAGANLSTEYFVNRQDRYVFFGGATSLSDYFYDLALTLTKISYQLAPHHTLIPSGPDPTTNPLQFRQTAFHALDTFLTNWYARTQPLRNNNKVKRSKLSKNTDTIVIPMLQMKQLHIEENERLMEIIMRIIDENSDYWKNIFITSGYLNFTTEFKNLLNEAHANVDILCAAPQANSFYKNPGISGYIPAVYTYFERQVHDETSNKDLKVHEYIRPGWTYHAKGLWASYKNEKTGELLPNVTILGSTNFGRRSMKRDVEAQVLLITDNKKLQKEIAKEIDNLLNYTVIVNNETFDKQERQIPLPVKVVTKLFQSMF